MLYFASTLQCSNIIKDPQGVPNKTNRQRQGVFFFMIGEDEYIFVDFILY